MYLHATSEVSRSSFSKVRAQTGQTDTHVQTDVTEHITTPHLIISVAQTPAFTEMFKGTLLLRGLI